jgi:phosphatidylethanolamine/phosphatidyl-N-methylethanolamine N-methyltransferase
VASVVPSSRGLARLMAKDLDADARVVELGAGTGTLTQAIIERGVQPRNLYLVEQNAAFASILRIQPGRDGGSSQRRVLAGALERAHGNRRLRDPSGLPILWFNKEKKTRILAGAFELLKPAGRYHQFTYLGRVPVGNRILDTLSLRTTLLGMAPMNLPPAFVYRFDRA